MNYKQIIGVSFLLGVPVCIAALVKYVRRDTVLENAKSKVDESYKKLGDAFAARPYHENTGKFELLPLDFARGVAYFDTLKWQQATATYDSLQKKYNEPFFYMGLYQIIN